MFVTTQSREIAVLMAKNMAHFATKNVAHILPGLALCAGVNAHLRFLIVAAELALKMPVGVQAW